MCAQGIRLRELVGGDLVGWVTRLPCLALHRQQQQLRPVNQTVSCEQFTPETAEDLAQQEAQMQAMMHRMVQSEPLVQEIKQANKGRSTAGESVCPVCQGKLHWTHARYNGHVSLHCETDGCLNFVE